MRPSCEGREQRKIHQVGSLACEQDCSQICLKGHTVFKALVEGPDGSFRDISLGIAEYEAMIGVGSQLVASFFDGDKTLLCSFVVAS